MRDTAGSSGDAPHIVDLQNDVFLDHSEEQARQGAFKMNLDSSLKNLAYPEMQMSRRAGWLGHEEEAEQKSEEQTEEQKRAKQEREDKKLFKQKKEERNVE